MQTVLMVQVEVVVIMVEVQVHTKNHMIWEAEAAVQLMLNQRL